MSCPMEQDVMGPVLHNSAREEVGSENVYPQMAMFIGEMTKHEVDGYPISDKP